MSEGQQQLPLTINIETLPRITPISTSKITSPDYPHDFTDGVDRVVGVGGVGGDDRVGDHRQGWWGSKILLDRNDLDKLL
ncbi:hypothetical protein [Vibrio fluvialis]|uniref:hypothetical protein n=1 Tax=Vibrio fluvialis TaxID=676 RepID=UPI00096B999E|nr:hypothetical protein [Vibrio fluvialis]